MQVVLSMNDSVLVGQVVQVNSFLRYWFAEHCEQSSPVINRKPELQVHVAVFALVVGQASQVAPEAVLSKYLWLIWILKESLLDKK